VTDTVAVEYHLVAVEAVSGAGRLIAVATVELAIAGIPITLQGVQLKLTHDNKVLCQAPQWRHPRTGQWVPCILLPDELRVAIGSECTSAIEHREQVEAA
jgi:hypothetical protein